MLVVNSSGEMDHAWGFHRAFSSFEPFVYALQSSSDRKMDSPAMTRRKTSCIVLR